MKKDMFDVKNYQRACREAIPEGVVLLKNENDVLPFENTDKIAVFSRGQFEYVKSGSGSGGRVNAPYVTQFYDEFASRAKIDEEVSELYRAFIRENPQSDDGWTYAASQKQPVLDDEFVKRVAARCDKAVFMLSRICGESYDCEAEKGNWYLSDEERQSIETICKHFRGRSVVVFNGGNLIDFSWADELGVSALALAWQGGQEGARGTCDALFGDNPPSGRLADTIAKLEDYPQEVAARDTGKPTFGDGERVFRAEDIFVGYRYFETFAKEKVIYPFGFGLSYTTFARSFDGAEEKEDGFLFFVTVKNVGKRSGKEVVEVYCRAPQGKLGKPERVLCGYKKTKLLAAGESEKLEIFVSFDSIASFDEEARGYVLEAGEYEFFLGENVRDAKKEYSHRVEKTILLSKAKGRLAPSVPFEKMTRKDGALVYEEAKTGKIDFRLDEKIEETPYAGKRGILLKDVARGERSLDEFVAQFTAEELAMLVRGEGMSSTKGSVTGSASCFGGVSDVWAEAGVPVITTCDGPSGMRLECCIEAQQIPSGTTIACSWNEDAWTAVYEGFAGELLSRGVDVVLGPGLNIHRHPLGGRNFEYYSEDPFLSGRQAAAMARVMRSRGAFATLKHFACNEQEFHRGSVDEQLSERALREIYLKPFEIAVKSGCVRYIMTSYNRLSGTHCCNLTPLLTDILRGEWGFTGAVMTDWWSAGDDVEKLKKNDFGGGLADEEANIYKLASLVEAQNDLYMVVPDAQTYKDDLTEQIAKGNVSLGALQRAAKNVLRVVMETETFKRGDFKRKDLLLKTGEKLYEIALESDKFRVSLPEEKEYVMRFTYAIDGDPLAQYKLTVRVNMQVTVNPVVRGTNGQIEESPPFSVYLPKDAEFWFEGASWRAEGAPYRIVGVTLYEKAE